MKAVRPYVGEHDDEAAPGLPAPLPANERLLWRGSPDAWLLARRGFHVNKFALYFGVLIAWRLVSTLADGGTLGVALATTLWTVPLAALALGFIALLAWMVARTTIYTLTDRRLVMRVGIVLTVTFNLPLRRIETARLHALGGEAGDIALVLNAQDRIGYLHLWPHARPWHFARTEPMLRALPQAGTVASLLAEALKQSLVTRVRTVVDRPAHEGQPAANDQRQRAGANGPSRLANAA